MVADQTLEMVKKLKEPFTTADLAGAMGRGKKLAQKMAYCLRRMGVIQQVGRRGRANVYARAVAQAVVGGEG